RLARRRLARVVGRVGIEGREGRHAGAQHLHRRRLLRERPKQGDQPGRELPGGGGGERLDVRGELLAARQGAVPQEINHLFERGVLDEVVDVVAAVDQPAFPPVDEADFRRRDDDVLETAFGFAAHGRPSPPCGENGLLLSYVARGFKPRPCASTTSTTATRLTRLVGLEGRVRVVRGDASALPFREGSFDACVSQEAFQHIADKLAVLAGCRRVLAPGGRLAFTDWIARARLGERERARLAEWMAATTLQSIDSYRALLGRAGFVRVEAEDVSD